MKETRREQFERILFSEDERFKSEEDEILFFLSTRLYEVGAGQHFTITLQELIEAIEYNDYNLMTGNLELDLFSLGESSGYILCYSEKISKFFYLDRRTIVNPNNKFEPLDKVLALMRSYELSNYIETKGTSFGFQTQNI
jgi:hypothetical protein